MSSERELGSRGRIIEGLSGTLGIDASGEVLIPAVSDLVDALTGARKLAAREIDFVFSPPRRDRQTQERIFDDLAALRMGGGE